MRSPWRSFALGALVERSLPAATHGDAYALAFTEALGDVYVIAAVATLLTAAAAWMLVRTDDLWSAPAPAPRRRASPRPRRRHLTAQHMTRR